MSRRIRTIIGIVLSLALLAWAMRDVSFAEVAHRIRTAEPLALTAAVAVALAGFWFRVVRWGILLKPSFGHIPFRSRWAATYIGFAGNNLLPARIGEFARAYALNRLTGVGLPSAFATLVIERLLDGLVIVGLLFAAMAAPDFPVGAGIAGVDLGTIAATFSVGIAAIGVGLYLVVAAPRRAARLARFLTGFLPERLRDPTVAALRSFHSGLAVLRDVRLFLLSLALAAGQWIFLALSFLFALRAFGIDEVPFSGAVFLQSLVSLAVAIPSSPGFFGPFEAASRVGLTLWNVPAEQAISYAIGFHIAGFIPVTLIGVYYVWRLGLSWSTVRESEESMEEELSSAHGDVTAPRTPR